MSVEPVAESTGRTVGPYRLEGEIGRGGMGVVYRATRVDTGETVAVKLMLPEIAANPHFRERFVREASLGSDLDHPNIVPIYDAGDIDGELFLAMRLIEGRDLKEVLAEEGRFEAKRLLGILRQVAHALDAAHESGVVHHDIKPQNILVSDTEEAADDVVFVTDFGLVKPAGSESTNSRTGSQVFGSIQYMPPEQVEGLPADGRADVYALGCVIYECLTGQIPFDRPNEIAVLWAHVHEDPSRVTDVRPELPGGLDAVVATAMAKRPDDRFLTCGELVEAFEKGLQRSSRPLVMPIVRPLVKRVPRRKTESEVWAPNYFPELSRVRKLTDRTNWLQVIAITSILCLLAAALVHFAHPRGIGGAVNDVALAVGESVLSAGKQVSSAFDGDDGREKRGAGRRARAGEDEWVDGGMLAAGAARSGRNAPRRSTAGVDAGGTLARDHTDKGRVDTVVGAAGRRAEIVFDAPGPWWTNYAALYTMKSNGRGVRLLYNSPQPDREPTWSPDGRQVAFASGDSIYVVAADGSGARRITYDAVPSREPSWSPDGRFLAYARAGVASNDWDIYVVEVTRRAVGIASQITGGPAVDRDPEWSPDGTSILFTRTEEEQHRLLTIDADGTGTRTLTAASMGAEQAEWSPDGSRVVFVDGTGSIRVLDLRSSTTKRISCPGWCYEPSFSPDGDTLLFNSCKSGCGGSALYSIDIGGSGGLKKLEEEVGPETEADWR